MKFFRASLLAAMLCTVAVHPVVGAQIHILSVPAGYTTGSIELGVPFAGSLAPLPSDPTKLYVSVGSYGAQSIALVDTVGASIQIVASGFGSIGGIAVLSNGDLAITENATSETILRAHDLTNDGDFLDPGEITALISPILADSPFGFTGAQIALAPAGNAAAIPAGALVIQTADGETSSELLVVENPETSPAFRPAGGAFFSGFQYNGGIDFSNSGHVIMGEGMFDMLTFTSSGRIYALVNTNADAVIGAGEWNVLVSETQLAAGLSDLAISKEDDVFTVEGSGTVRTFALPPNLLSGSATPAVFAQTDSPYLSTVRFDDKTKTFAPGATAPSARLYLGGYASDWTAATNLVWIQPQPTSHIENWAIY
ncbi:MAG: hypothetical protein D6691_11875 [Candidatus Hydrogenedentota bacterium]|nr:hypothetical protein [Candidatus Sumerlaea chitinivorans]RMH24272.1 MAG: hypothetical protein D6691_11875 [Candidatus Hydrogenedentota bacterium]